MSILDVYYARTVPLLFHYTDQRALISIWEKGELWASVAYYLNDSTEFYDGIKLAREVLTERINANSDPSLLENLQLMRGCIGRITDMTNVFICCFCIDGDLLSQWRGYAGGSYGYAIGFDSERLKFVADRAGFDIRQCIYCREDQRQLVNALVDKYVQNPGTTDRDKGGNFITPLSQLVCCFKNKGFVEENEWRLVSRLDHSSERYPRNLAFRPGPSMIIPMAKIDISDATLPIGHLPITNITVGPTPHPKLAMDAVLKLAHSLRNQGLQVSKSLIPFRAW